MHAFLLEKLLNSVQWWLWPQEITTGLYITFHMSRLACPTSQFLNGTHKFSELVLARMAMPMDQSHSVFPLWLAKVREFGELWREKSMCVPWIFPFKLARTSSFRPARTDKWKAT